MESVERMLPKNHATRAQCHEQQPNKVVVPKHHHLAFRSGRATMLQSFMALLCTIACQKSQNLEKLTNFQKIWRTVFFVQIHEICMIYQTILFI